MKKVSFRNMKTKNRYRGDEIISALQKSIRRGQIEHASYWAWELSNSSIEFQNKLWERLVVISVEDIGLANPNAINTVCSAQTAYNKTYAMPDDKHLFAIFAASYLASCRKDRFADEIKYNFKHLGLKFNIPDEAIDKHTVKGRNLNRGDSHFWTEATKISPENKSRILKFKKEILKHLKSTS